MLVQAMKYSGLDQDSTAVSPNYSAEAPVKSYPAISVAKSLTPPKSASRQLQGDSVKISSLAHTTRHPPPGSELPFAR